MRYLALLLLLNAASCSPYFKCVDGKLYHKSEELPTMQNVYEPSIGLDGKQKSCIQE